MPQNRQVFSLHVLRKPHASLRLVQETVGFVGLVTCLIAMKAYDVSRFFSLFVLLLFLGAYVSFVWPAFDSNSYPEAMTLQDAYDYHDRSELYQVAIPMTIALIMVGGLIRNMAPLLGPTLLVLGIIVGVLTVAIDPSTGIHVLDHLLSAVTNGISGAVTWAD